MDQNKVTNKNLQAEVQGTTKAAVIEGDNEYPNIVAFSVYDTKPVKFLSTACTSLLWKEKTKKIFDKDAGIKILLIFLCPQVMDEYNYGMSNVDQIDQHKSSYRFDHWMQRHKWWWLIWMWEVQVLLVNAYVLYNSAHLLIWKTPKKDILLQYDLQVNCFRLVQMQSGKWR